MWGQDVRVFMSSVKTKEGKGVGDIGWVVK